MDHRSEREPLVQVRGLVKQFPRLEKRSMVSFLKLKRPMVTILDGVSLTIYKGETLGLIGESGCGKTTFGRCILRLVEPTAGEVFFDGQDLLSLKNNELRHLRKRMQMIFQNPFAALNPNMKVRDILAEAVRVRWDLSVSNNGRRAEDLSEEKVDGRIIELVRSVNLQRAKLTQYPFELSGGERRRVGVARILAVEPDFIVADEPLASLDASIRSQILNLLLQLRKDHNLTFLYISHDIGAIRQICDRVAVMYLGNVVELAEKKEIREDRSYHPYTKKLMKSCEYLSVDQLDVQLDDDDDEAAFLPESDLGCNYRFRCERFRSLDEPDVCVSMKPVLQLQPNPYSEGHMVACHFAQEED